MASRRDMSPGRQLASDGLLLLCKQVEESSQQENVAPSVATTAASDAHKYDINAEEEEDDDEVTDTDDELEIMERKRNALAAVGRRSSHHTAAAARPMIVPPPVGMANAQTFQFMPTSKLRSLSAVAAASPSTASQWVSSMAADSVLRKASSSMSSGSATTSDSPKGLTIRTVTDAALEAQCRPYMPISFRYTFY